MKPANPVEQLRSAQIDDLDPVRHALAAIEGISDGQLMVKKLREFVADHGPLVPLLGDINAYPSSAKVLNDFTTGHLAAALKNPPKALANQAQDQPRDSLGQWVDENGGGLSIKDNLQRGNNAVDRALRQKADVQKAMHRKEVGQIDFEYGRPGSPKPNDQGKTYADGYGISHVLAKHKEEAVRQLPEVLAKGKITQHPLDLDKRVVTYDGNLRLKNGKITKPLMSLPVLTQKKK